MPKRVRLQWSACRSSNVFPTSAKDAAPTSSMRWPRRSARVPGVRVLDVQSDATHNRSVFTLAGDRRGPGRRRSQALRGRALPPSTCARTRASTRAWARSTSCPFIPIEGVTMAECVALAKAVAADVAARFALPIYLYEDASANPARKNLEDIRRGEFEGLAAKMAQPAWAPDFGPAAPHAERRRLGHRRAHAAHRLQHQPRHQPARRRQEDCRRHSHEQRRPALRQGHGHPARRPRHRAGVDEPHQLREDADLSACSTW